MIRVVPFLIAVTALGAPTAAPFELGANFNEHLHAARVPALDATGVKWIRGFLPACEFLDGPRRLATDSELAGFRLAAASGRKVALTLKWDFKKAKQRVPAPDSARESACFAWAVEVVREGRPDLLLLVNEVFIDTPDDDMRLGADGTIPMVQFLQRLAAHVHAAGLHSPSGAPLPVSCGGLTRLDRKEIQEHPATRALLPWLATTPDLTHVNFHLHELSYEQFASALDFIRQAVPKRPFVVTEFSLVWSFAKHLEDRLDDGPGGHAFVEKFHRDSSLIVRDYLSQCAAHPVPEEELHAFLASRSWFDPDFLEKSCRMMAEHGVVLATYAYLQESSGLERAGSPVPRGGVPWRLNAIFQERNAVGSESGQLATNLGLYATFVRYQH